MATKNIVVLTGTPGTGKTRVSQVLCESDWHVLDLNGLAKSCGLLGQYDAQDKAHEVDIKTLEKVVKSVLAHLEKPIVIDGHLACEIKIGGAIAFVLRCNPDELKSRLEKRGYGAPKIAKNSLAEMLDYCTVSCERNYRQVIELDTTSSTPEGIAVKIMQICEGKRKMAGDKVDWSKKLYDLDVRKLVEG